MPVLGSKNFELNLQQKLKLVLPSWLDIVLYNKFIFFNNDIFLLKCYLRFCRNKPRHCINSLIRTQFEGTNCASAMLCRPQCRVNALMKIHRLHGSYEALKYGTLLDGLADLTGGITESISIRQDPTTCGRMLNKLLEMTSLITCTVQTTSTQVSRCFCAEYYNCSPHYIE
jgi:hypothetical protein